MSRRRARELAFLILFQVDLGHTPWEEALQRTLVEEEISEAERVFLEEVVSGAMDKLQEVDKILTRYSVDWPLSRMACTDRNILRLAVYELLYQSKIPVGVSVNEAVELAKKYGEEDSGKFVNGILGTIIQEFRNLVAASSKPGIPKADH